MDNTYPQDIYCDKNNNLSQISSIKKQNIIGKFEGNINNIIMEKNELIINIDLDISDLIIQKNILLTNLFNLNEIIFNNNDFKYYDKLNWKYRIHII